MVVLAAFHSTWPRTHLRVWSLAAAVSAERQGARSEGVRERGSVAGTRDGEGRRTDRFSRRPPRHDRAPGRRYRDCRLAREGLVVSPTRRSGLPRQDKRRLPLGERSSPPVRIGAHQFGRATAGDWRGEPREGSTGPAKGLSHGFTVTARTHPHSQRSRTAWCWSAPTCRCPKRVTSSTSSRRGSSGTRARSAARSSQRARLAPRQKWAP
jgi:hypothetical protein